MHAYFYLRELCITSWGMCKWHLGFSLIVLHEALLHFLFFPPFLNFQCQLASFDSTFIGMFRRLLRPYYLECLEVPLVCQQLSSHLQMWDKSCLCGGYRFGNVLGELGAYRFNHHIQIFAK